MPSHPRLRARAAALLLTGALAATLVACSGTGSPDATEAATDTATVAPTAGGTLTFARSASTDSLDVNSQITANNAFAIDKIFESLLTFDTDGAIEPWLAESYDISDDQLTYTFHLRDGLLFSDGTPVTADDVVFSLNRHLQVEGPLPLSAPVTDIEATDESTVTLTLSSPYTPFLGQIAQFSNGIYPKDFGGRSEEEFFADPVGTGPFVLDEWDPSGDISFVKNEHYWQEGKPYVDRLVYQLVADDTQQVQQLSSGEVDVIDSVNPASVEQLEANDAVSVSRTGGWAIEQVFFNTLDEHFADVDVRRAIAQAIDREGLTAATTFGTADVADALIPPTIEYSAAAEGYALPYDVDAAKESLADSAYPDGFTTTLLVASGNSQRAQEAQIIQQALAPIGITVEIESIDLASFRARFRALDYQFMINSGLSDAPDPDGLVTFQADPAGFSQSYWTSYSDPEVTDLIAQGRATAPGDDREQIYLQIQKILADDVPYIPLFYPQTLKATTSSVHGLTVLPNGSIRFQDAWIEQ